MDFVRGRWKLEFDHIGEGLDGDYDPSDPEDTPLLRADLWCNDPDLKQYAASEPNEEGWWEPRDASYCTLAPDGSKEEDLRAGANELFDELDAEVPRNSPKRVMERWTWRKYPPVQKEPS